MAAYGSQMYPFVRELQRIRETNPALIADIERRADEIYAAYDEDETYSRGKTTSRARAMQQALQEYKDRESSFQQLDRSVGGTSERELDMSRMSSPDPSGMIRQRKDRLNLAGLGAALRDTPTGKSNAELLEQMAMDQLAIGDVEKEEKRIGDLFNEELGSLEPDTETQPDEYYYDKPGPIREFREQTLSPDKSLNDELGEEEEGVDEIPARPTTPFLPEEDSQEDFDALIEEFLAEDSKEGDVSLDLQGLQPRSKLRAKLDRYGPSLLQALGAAGQSYFDNRAISQANKQNRRSQASANLINALSRGGGARGASVAPETGVGSALFKSLSTLGKGLEAQREVDRQSERDKQLQEYRNKQLEVQAASQQNRIAAKAQADQAKEYERQVEDLIDVVSAAAESGQLTPDNFEEYANSERRFSLIYNKLPKNYQERVALAVTGAAAGAAPGEAASLSNTVSILENAYNRMDDPGNFITGVYFDALSGLSNRAANRYMPNEAVYESVADAFTISLASAFNEGRPSNADAAAVANLLPRVGAGDEANKQRFAILRKLADFAKYAENKNFQLPGASDGLRSSGIIRADGTVDEGKLEEYRRSIGMPDASTSAQTPSAPTDTGNDDWAGGSL